MSSISQNTSHFSLPLPLWQQPISYRTAKYEGFKQRGRYKAANRDGDGDGEDEDEDNSIGSGEGSGERMSGDERSAAEAERRRRNKKNRKKQEKEKEKGGKRKKRRGRSSSRAGSVRSGSVVLGPDEYHQYRIAGMPVDLELPGGNFPHSPAPEGFLAGSEEEDGDEEDDDDETDDSDNDESDGEGVRGRRKGHTTTVDDELSKLNPPVYLPGGNPTRKHALRLRHLGVITTILHRCLMEGDYVRAGRAWGLILRDDFGGHGMDVRSGGRWGVGAEILLWKDQSRQTMRSQNRENTNMDRDMDTDMDGGNVAVEGEYNSSSSGREKWFTRAGFERAKEYYNRLILHYPYRKMAPNALSPLDFYPAMFGLWISLVQEESRIGRETAMNMAEEEDEDDDLYGRNDFNDGYGDPPPFDDYAAADDRMSISSDLPSRPRRQRRNRKVELILQSRARELEEAQQIASQIDDLLVSPPYSDSHEILRLRAMISLWISDLLVSSVSVEEDDLDPTANDGYGGRRDNDGDLDLGFGFRDDRGDSDRVRIEAAKEKRSTELEKAKMLFDKAKTRRMRAQSSMG